VNHLDLEVRDYKDAGSGGFTAVASDGSVDRDGEIIDPGAFEPLPSKVPVHLGHGGPLVGSGRPRYAGTRLLIDATFAVTKQAQEARELVKGGHLEQMSVVFMRGQDKVVQGVRHITKGELLACDLVSIPSNRETRVLASRDYSGTMTVAEARRFVDKTIRDLVRMDLEEVEQLLAAERGPASAYVHNILKEL
jgi:HK97 family phage prohead protease